MGTKKITKIFSNSIIQILLMAWSLMQVMPVLWLILSSFKPSVEISSHLLSPPKSFYINNYNFSEYNLATGAEVHILTYLRNSIIITISTLVILMTICFFAGFALAKIKFPGKNVLLIILIIFLGIPIYTIIIPLYYLISNMGLNNNYFGLILPYVAIWCPFTILMLQTYFRQFPDDLIDAAKIDGCNIIQAFIRVVLPTSLGAVSMVLVVNFISIWNEFLLSLTILKNTGVKTLTVGLMGFKGQFITDWGPLFAALTISFIPSIIVYCVFHRSLIKGIHAGALKE